MSRQLDAKREEKQRQRDARLLLVLEGGLFDDLSQAGADLTGFGVRLVGGDCLLTIRGLLAGRAQISFVGAETLGDALLKASRLARSDGLNWRDDKYASK